MSCPRCGVAVSREDLFCSSCGGPLRHDAGEATLHPPRSKGLGTALILLLNLGLLGGSAWLVYTVLAQRQHDAAPTVQLGTPRLFPPKSPAASRAKTGKTATRDKARPRTHRTPTVPPRPKVRVPLAARKDLSPTKARRPSPATQPAVKKQPPADAAMPSKAAGTPDAAAESPADRRRAQINAGSIRLVVRHHLPQIQACYERVTKRGQRVGGMIEVRFVINPMGQLRRSQVHSNTTGSASLGVCIAATMGRWKFPRPVGGEVEFIYPFVFSSSR